MKQYKVNTEEIDINGKQHYIDAFAYAVSTQMAVQLDNFFMAHINKKPWYIPKFIYDWLIKKLFVITKFKVLK